ncbi:MAG: hypothetical protein ACK5KR_04360 [Breznakia sp.]
MAKKYYLYTKENGFPIVDCNKQNLRLVKTYSSFEEAERGLNIYLIMMQQKSLNDKLKA